MKRFIAMTLLLGYVMFVPFCFFGGMFATNVGTVNMIGGHTFATVDCGMSPEGCAHGTSAHDTGRITHHVSMYNLITQSPLAVMLMITMVMAVSLLLAFASSHDRLTTFFSQISLRPPPRRADEPQSRTKLNILTWLSLFETSPNFAQRGAF